METDIKQMAPAPPRRTQRYFRFQLQPGDMDLIDLLPEEQRKALLSEGSYMERALQLNIPVGTVRSRLHRARAALEALRGRRPDASIPPN